MPIALRPASEPPADLRLVLHSCSAMQAACQCAEIERVDQYKYLGVIFDSKLNWEFQINLLKSKLRKMIFVFFQLREILNEKEIRSIYYAYVQSLLNYGILAWGGVGISLLNSLSVVQKSIIKIAFKKHKQFPSNQLFLETKLLSIRQLYIKSLLTYTYSHKDLVLVPVVHRYHTRNAVIVGLQVPRAVKSVCYSNSFFIANFVYRNIPPEIRNLQVSNQVFKKIVHDWLVVTGSEHAEALIRSQYNAP